MYVNIDSHHLKYDHKSFPNVLGELTSQLLTSRASQKLPSSLNGTDKEVVLYRRQPRVLSPCNIRINLKLKEDKGDH